MPTPDRILEGLAETVRDWRGLAIAWHVIVFAALGFTLAGIRPSRRVAVFSLAVPLVSAGVIALLEANPFNAAMLLALAAAIIGIAPALESEPIEGGPPWSVGLGTILIAFAICYPHFVEGSSLAPLIASPIGVIPCPTLSLVIGVALFTGALGSRALAVTLSLAGLFYGLFGVARLGVWIDVVLLAGAAALPFTALRRIRPSPLF